MADIDYQSNLPELAKFRAQFDSRATLKKVLRDIQQMLSADLSPEQRQSLKELVFVSLDHVGSQLNKADTLDSITERELEHFKKEELDIIEQQRMVAASLSDLRERLATAEQERAQKIQYDEIYKKIVQFPTCGENKSLQENLLADIQLLKKDMDDFTTNRAESRLQINDIAAKISEIKHNVTTQKQDYFRSQILNGTDRFVGDEDAANGEIMEDEHKDRQRAVSLNPSAKPFDPKT